MDMDLAIKFGNIDALICKAEQFIQEGDKQNGFRLVLEASRELRSIEISGNLLFHKIGRAHNYKIYNDTNKFVIFYYRKWRTLY